MVVGEMILQVVSPLPPPIHDHHRFLRGGLHPNRLPRTKLSALFFLDEEMNELGVFGLKILPMKQRQSFALAIVLFPLLKLPLLGRRLKSFLAACNIQSPHQRHLLGQRWTY